MKFKKEWLQELVYYNHNEVEIFKNSIIGRTRWAENYELVFKYEDKLYRITYYEGDTTNPFEYEKDLIECVEVVPIQKTITITVYEPKK